MSLQGAVCPDLGFPLFVMALLGLSSLRLQAATINEVFASNPLNRQWRMFGDSSLFVFDPAAQNLKVTWDSSRSNSYFYLPLTNILGRDDDFGLSLDLNLTDIKGGANTNKPSTFEMAFGFLNITAATGTNFFRGNSALTPDLFEFDYFPDTGFGPTIWPSVWSTNSTLSYNGPEDYTLLFLPTGVVMHVTMNYWSSNHTVITVISTNGVSIGNINSSQLSPTFTDFRINTFAIESYSDSGQDPRYGGSLLAHGVVDNIVLTIPPPPVKNLSVMFTNQAWQVSFSSRTNWLYALERSEDLQTWSTASGLTAGTGSRINWTDTNAPGPQVFYRIRAAKP